MGTIYFRTQTTVSFINYHFVFCPKYRRKIFLIPNVEARFKELTREICKELRIEILAPADIMKKVKGASSHVLRSEFSQLSGMTALWTRSYFVSTAVNVSSETIKWYVDTQKTRG